MARATHSRLWGGRFAEGPHRLLQRLNDSFSFDRELLGAEIEASRAWAGALAKAGALSPAEHRRIDAALAKVADDAAARGLPADGFEDVHSYVEAALKRRVGSLAGKLHAGRSRNDQVATDFRLWLKAALAEARTLSLDLATALCARAAAEAATPIPGYTHLQRAVPVTFGHWCLAYVEMILRDADRLATAIDRADECPLGAGALAGTPLPIDRAALARALGFARPSANSLDAVSDRDTAVEYLFCGALLLTHLSRMAEDLILFTSDEFGFAALPDALATGSSRMPQKKNPDLLELVRAHAGRATGALAGLLAVLKGLPLAYNKDLQLDKEPAFALRGTLSAALPALALLVATLTLDRVAMRRAASSERLLVTELADALARRGVPFRKAHELVGRRLRAAEAKGTTLMALGPGGGIIGDDLKAIDLDKALRRRGAAGGTSPARVKAAARDAKGRITAMRRGHAVPSVKGLVVDRDILPAPTEVPCYSRPRRGR